MYHSNLSIKVGVFVVALVSSVLLILPTVYAQTTVECTVSFVAAVRQGTNAGLSLQGEMRLTVEPSGNATGVLETDDGTSIDVIGQVNNRAFNLVFDLGNDTYVFGVGTSVYEFNTCDPNNVARGPLVGPEIDDTGAWGFGFCAGCNASLSEAGD